MMVVSKHHLELYRVISMVIDDTSLYHVGCTRTSGVQMNRRLTVTPPTPPRQLSVTITRLSSLRHYLTTEVATSDVNDLGIVNARMDYCNPPLSNISSSETNSEECPD